MFYIYIFIDRFMYTYIYMRTKHIYIYTYPQSCRLKYIYNKNSAFGVPRWHTWLLTVFLCIICLHAFRCIEMEINNVSAELPTDIFGSCQCNASLKDI